MHPLTRSLSLCLVASLFGCVVTSGKDDSDTTPDAEDTDEDVSDSEDDTDVDDTEDTEDTEDTNDTEDTDDTNDTEDTDDTDLGAHPITAVGHNGLEILAGDDYFDTTADGIVPYSFARNILDIRNDSTVDVTINSVTVTPQGDVFDFEWTYIDPDISAPTPLVVHDHVLGAGELLEGEVYFYPVEAGHRVADVVITYNTTETYAFTVTGRGRDAWSLTDAGVDTTEKIHGDPDNDTLPGGADLDEDDNLYFSGNISESLDSFSANLLLARMDKNGSLAWQKEWHESYEQLSPDPGQNGESGGSADSLDHHDGYVYLVGRRSQSSANSLFQSLVMKVDDATGDIEWAIGWSPDDDNPPSYAWQSSQAYAVDAGLSDRVIVVGSSFGTADVSLLAFDKGDGHQIWAKQIDIAAAYNDRAYGVKVDGDGNAWVVGSTHGDIGLVARVTGVDGGDPKLDFVKQVDMGTGGNLNSVDVDDDGNAYVSLDRRGAATYLSIARFDTDGSLAWAKTWDEANANDNDNSYVVRVHEDSVYLGGRVSFETGDTQYGEGFLLALHADDGSYDWGAAYYTGKGAEEVVEHRVKGIEVDSKGDLRLLVQSYAVSLNFEHYWGYWYGLMDDPLADLTLGEDPGDGALLLTDYAPTITDVTDEDTFRDVDGAYNGSNVATVHTIDTSGIWQDPPATLTWEEARDREGNGVDADSMLLVFER